MRPTANSGASPSVLEGEGRWLGGCSLLVIALVWVGLTLWASATVTESSYIAKMTTEREKRGVSGSVHWAKPVAKETMEKPRVFLDNDPYYWVSYARRVAAGEALRIRHTDVDNAPFGRDVHWSSAFVWLLVLFGWLWHLASGEVMSTAIESAGFFINPVLLWMFLAAVGVGVGRRVSFAFAALLVVVMASLSAVVWDFGYARPDHHSLHFIAFLGSALCLLLGGGGFVRRESASDCWFLEYARARAWFFSAGFFTGFGLWIGATQQFILTTILCLGAAVSMMLVIWREKDADILLAPVLWRDWLWAAAVSGAFFYIVEYFPNFPLHRMEVNHPLFWISLVGVGMCLRGLPDALTGQRRPWGLACLVIGVGLAASIPAVLLLGPTDLHAMRDPFMARTHDTITEFKNYSSLVSGSVTWALLTQFNFLTLLPFVGIVSLAVFRRSASWKLGLSAFATVPTILLAGLLLYQVRWAGLLSAALCVLLLALYLVYRGDFLHGRMRMVAGACVLTPSLLLWAMNCWDTMLNAKSPLLPRDLARIVASMDVARNLKRLSSRTDVRVISSAGETPCLWYYGGVRGVSSLYWENIEGVRDASQFFSSTDDSQARDILARRGVTHVLTAGNPALAEQQAWVGLGTKSPDLIKRTLAYRLSDPLGELPTWLEPVPIYSSPMASEWQVRLFRVVQSRPP